MFYLFGFLGRGTDGPDSSTVCSYTSGAGTLIQVPKKFNPWTILGITPDEKEKVKSEFRSRIKTSSRETRMLVSLAYDAITSPKAEHYQWIGDEVIILEVNDHVRAAVGAPFHRVSKLVDETKRSILYTAARSGFL